MEIPALTDSEDLDVASATFSCPDVTAFAGLDELGLEAIGQRLEPDRAVLACRVVTPDGWCRRGGCQGVARDTVLRSLAHEPLGWRPTTLHITIRRYRCTECGHVWRQDTSKAAEPRAKVSCRGLRWALEGIVCQHLTVARIAEGLGVSWNTANAAVLAEGKRVLLDDGARFDGVTTIRAGTGPARLLDMVEGRSKQAFKQWLADRPQQWRGGVEVVAMDGFTGFKTAAAEELPGAAAMMDPFHVVRLAGDAPDRCRQRVQQDTCGHRGRKRDPLYRARRTLHTGAGLRTDKQAERLRALFADDSHVEVEATWGIYQRTITAYRHPDRSIGRALMDKLITDVITGVPKALTELITLGRTLKKRATDVLAYCERPGTSNGPTEALNGRLEHLRGSALGFRNNHALHHEMSARVRRLQTGSTLSITMSPFGALFATVDRRSSGRFTATGCFNDAPINSDLVQVETDDRVVGFQADLLELVEDAGGGPIVAPSADCRR